jgi:TolA-binding protein
VPSDKLDAVLGELGSVGKVIRSSSSSQNVGAQIIDAQSRLATMRVSVERVRGFLDKATDLTQIVTLEAELTRRESDLEALEAQLASLKGSVARSPIQVSLTTEPTVIAPPAPATGFLAGLTNGWKAFAASVSVVLTVVGAVLPFGVLALLIGLPLWLVLRRRRTVQAPPAVVVP